MKKAIFLITLSFLTMCSSVNQIDSKKVTSFFVGTYTNGESEGIYKYQIDSEGRLLKIGLMAKANNPSFLAKTIDNKTLLAVDETDKNGTGFIKSYEVKEDTLLFVSKSKSGGAHPCFITVNDKNQVLVANYSGGNVGYLNIDNQNGLTNLLSIQQHTGKGTTDRQKAPHAHSAWFHPKTNKIISADLGTNELWFSLIDESKNQLVFSEPKTLKMAEGAGPRHLAFHPNKEWIYVLNELNNTVSLVLEKEGIYQIKETISTLPNSFSDYSKAADIHISKDGKFLYASNRGHNSLAIYKVNSENGFLQLIDFENVKGVNPRNFAITPDDNFLVVANQDSNNLVSFQRNPKTGKLTFANEIKAPNPVCVLF